jgi:hypothetical protein
MLLVAGVLALAFASGAWAAGTITGKSIRDDSLTGKDIKNHSVTKTDLKGNFRGARGPRGLQGDQGIQGPQGPGGVLGQQVIEATLVLQPGDVAGPQAFCPPGKVPVGSGFFASVAHVGFVEVFGSSVGAGFINDSSIPVETKVQAVCAGGGASAASAGHVAARRAFASMLAKVRTGVR